MRLKSGIRSPPHHTFYFYNENLKLICTSSFQCFSIYLEAEEEGMVEGVLKLHVQRNGETDKKEKR